MKKIFLIGLVLLSGLGFSFEAKFITWDVSSKEELRVAYEKAIAWFTANSNCKVDMKYASYSDHTSMKPYDQSQGFYKRNNSSLHISSLGITTIQNEKMCLVVDTVNRIIIIKNKTEITKTPVDSKSLLELLDNVKLIRKQPLADNGIAYRLEFKPNELYTAFEFKVNSKGQFLGTTYYYSKEIQEDEEGPKSLKGKPRMEIVFSNYESNIKFDFEKEFSEKKFIHEDGGKVALNKEYKNYELKDYRFEEKK